MGRFLLVLCTFLAVACQPIGPLPGSALRGVVIAPPPDWGQLGTAQVVQLETRPDAPYSVNIWGVADGAKYYVAAGGGGKTKWTAYIAANSNVRLRIAKSIFELRATRVQDAAELKRIGGLYEAKYKLSADRAAEANNAWVYRLDPR